jgi:hypothetical protein
MIIESLSSPQHQEKKKKSDFQKPKKENVGQKFSKAPLTKTIMIRLSSVGITHLIIICIGTKKERNVNQQQKKK